MRKWRLSETKKSALNPSRRNKYIRESNNCPLRVIQEGDRTGAMAFSSCAAPINGRHDEHSQQICIDCGPYVSLTLGWKLGM